MAREAFLSDEREKSYECFLDELQRRDSEALGLALPVDSPTFCAPKPFLSLFWLRFICLIFMFESLGSSYGETSTESSITLIRKVSTRHIRPLKLLQYFENRGTAPFFTHTRGWFSGKSSFIVDMCVTWPSTLGQWPPNTDENDHDKIGMLHGVFWLAYSKQWLDFWRLNLNWAENFGSSRLLTWFGNVFRYLLLFVDFLSDVYDMLYIETNFLAVRNELLNTFSSSHQPSCQLEDKPILVRLSCRNGP